MKIQVRFNKTEKIKNELSLIQRNLLQTYAKDDAEFKNHLIKCALKRIDKILMDI